MKHLWLFAFIAVVVGCMEVVPGTCYQNPAGGAGGAGDMPIGAGVGATTSGDFADPPRTPQDNTDPPEGCSMPPGPCEAKCQADYETAAGECGKIESEAQRITCQDSAYARYKSCRENCLQASNDCLEKCKEQCDERNKECIKNCPKGDKNCMNECNQELGRCYKECEKRCK